MDVEGQYKRKLMRAKICPISGPGTLSKSAREHRAREIIAESGADSTEHFNKVVKKETGTLFRDQAKGWLKHVKSRNRKPVANSTLELWEGCLKNWINPAIGDLPLSEVSNSALRSLVAKMVRAELSAKTINNYTQVVKMVVASAVNSEGEQLFPRKWNYEFVDMPIVDKRKQNTPSFSAEIMSGLAKWKYPRERMLFVLCGSAGLRLGEALGLEIDKHISEDFQTLNISQKVRHCRVEERLKTRNAEREVDLHPDVAAQLRRFTAGRTSGFLFTTKNGKPLSSSCILRRHLHPALKQMKYVNPYTGDHKAGSHAFRRFRNTYLRNYTQCPEGLLKYWMGHAGDSMSYRYDKIKDDLAFRKMWAEKCGTGFDLGSVVPIVPKKAVKNAALKAA
jgi:integrase